MEKSTRLGPNRYQFHCKVCGKPFIRVTRRSSPVKGRRYPILYCSVKCNGESHRGENHPRWKGGRNVPKDTRRYIRVHSPGHPRANNDKVYEHILIAEKAMGRFLPGGAEVHHVNGIRQDNSPSNLVVCQDSSYHRTIETKWRRIKDTGSLKLKRCAACKEVFPIEDFYSDKRSFDKTIYHCKICYKEQRKIR